MYWIDTGTGVPTNPGTTPVISVARQYATEGGAGIQPTIPGPEWFNTITDEILAVLYAAGIAPDKSSHTQLLDALASLFASKSSVGNFAASQILSSNSVMSALAFGKSFWAAGNTPYQITLPPLSVSAASGGSVIEIFCSNPAGVTVTRAETDNILFGSSSIASFSIKEGQNVRLVSNLANGVYYMMGEAHLAWSPLFKSVLSGNGYQKLPGGFILQWGSSVFTSAGATIAFPVSFPNSCFCVLPVDNELTALSNFSTGSRTQSNFVGKTSASSDGASWVAIGF